MMRWALGWPLVLVAALGAAILFRAFLGPNYGNLRATDYVTVYRPVAVNLLEGRGLVLSDGAPAVSYPPGNSFLLVAVFWLADRAGVARELAVDIVAVLLHVVSTALLWRFAARVWGRPRAWLAPLVWATYPPALWLMPIGGSETPFVPVLIATVTCFWGAVHDPRLRWRSFCLTGLGCAAAMLLRPIALGIPLVLVAFLWLQRRELAWNERLVAGGMLGLGALVPVLPWELWMYQHHGKFEVLSSNGFASAFDGLTYARPSEDRVRLDVPEDVARLMADLRTERDAGAIDGLGQLSIWMFLQASERPGAVVKLVGLKIVRCWYATDSHRHEVALMLLQVPYGLLVLCAARHAWLQGGTARQLAILVLVLASYSWLMATAVLSILRYLVPAIALLFTLVPVLLKVRP